MVWGRFRISNGVQTYPAFDATKFKAIILFKIVLFCYSRGFGAMDVALHHYTVWICQAKIHILVRQIWNCDRKALRHAMMDQCFAAQ